MLGLVWAVLQAIAGVAATAAVALDQASKIHLTKLELALALAITAYLAAGAPIGRAIRNFRFDRSASFSTEVQSALGGALLLLLKREGFDIATAGLSVFVIRWSWWPYPRRRLERVARLRLAALPQGSNIKWTRGKGVIGRCWELNEPLRAPTAETYAGYLSCSRKQWRGLTRKERHRFRWREFRQIAPKYQGVVAIPIRGPKDQCVGVTSLDVKAGAAYDQISSDEAAEIVAEASRTIGGLLGAVRKWIQLNG